MTIIAIPLTDAERVLLQRILEQWLDEGFSTDGPAYDLALTLRDRCEDEA